MSKICLVYHHNSGLAKYGTPVCKLFPLLILKALLHYFPASPVATKSDAMWISELLYVTCFPSCLLDLFSVEAFRIFSLSYPWYPNTLVSTSQWFALVLFVFLFFFFLIHLQSALGLFQLISLSSGNFYWNVFKSLITSSPPFFSVFLFFGITINQLLLLLLLLNRFSRVRLCATP